MEVIYALLSSTMFAATFLLIKIGRQSASHLSVLWITLTVNVIVLTLASVLLNSQSSINIVDVKFFILAGFFAPLLGRLFQFIGMSKLGANVTTALTLTHPLVTVLIGLFFLGEDSNLYQTVGAGLVILGSILIAGFSGSTENFKAASSDRVFIIYPLLSSFTYGISIAFRKVGIDSFDFPVLASAVTVFSSWSILSVYLLLSNQKIYCKKKELKFFLIAGGVSSIGPVLLYLALSMGDLFMVAPLAATTPVFLLVGTWLYSKENEKFDCHVLFGTIGICIGISLLTLFKS